MVEQPYSRKAHYHAILIAGFNYVVITDGAAWLRYIFYAAFCRPFYVISKWEKCVRAKGYLLHVVKPCAFFLPCKYLWLLSKNFSHMPSASTSM